MATLSAEQFKVLLESIIPKKDEPNENDAGNPKNDPSALGPIR